MSSPFDLLIARSGNPAHARVTREKVSHRPAGVAASAVVILAEVFLKTPTEATGGGRHVKQRAVLRVDETPSRTLSLNDTWVVRERVWNVTEIKPADAGEIDVHIATTLPNLRTGARAKF